MNLLLHACCAPCAIVPVDYLKKNGYDVTLFFYNPNIHPYREFQKRKSCVEVFAKNNNLSLIVDDRYLLTDFLRSIIFREKNKCHICQEIRIKETATIARQYGFTFFSTTLLYSRYQRHDEIKKQCLEYSKRLSLPFVYEDFRVGWKTGIESAISQGLYRQSYCGCIFSEQERYDKKFQKVGNINDEYDRSSHKQ
jgi:hypothetical protein